MQNLEEKHLSTLLCAPIHKHVLMFFWFCPTINLKVIVLCRLMFGALFFKIQAVDKLVFYKLSKDHTAGWVAFPAEK